MASVIMMLTKGTAAAQPKVVNFCSLNAEKKLGIPRPGAFYKDQQIWSYEYSGNRFGAGTIQIDFFESCESIDLYSAVSTPRLSDETVLGMLQNMQKIKIVTKSKSEYNRYIKVIRGFFESEINRAMPQPLDTSYYRFAYENDDTVFPTVVYKHIFRFKAGDFFKAPNGTKYSFDDWMEKFVDIPHGIDDVAIVKDRELLQHMVEEYNKANGLLVIEPEVNPSVTEEQPEIAKPDEALVEPEKIIPGTEKNKKASKPKRIKAPKGSFKNSAPTKMPTHKHDAKKNPNPKKCSFCYHQNHLQNQIMRNHYRGCKS